jgi:hypothetical protein
MDWVARQVSGASLDPTIFVMAAAVAILVGLIGVTGRVFLLNTLEDLARLWGEASPAIGRAILRRRKDMPGMDWFCDVCSSHNSAVATRCYKCGAKREEAEAMVPGSDARADQQAGLTRRR